jgi:hypothetical protein
MEQIMSRREGGERRLPHRDTGSGGCDDGHRELVGGPTTQVLRRIADVCSTSAMNTTRTGTDALIPLLSRRRVLR